MPVYEQVVFEITASPHRARRQAQQERDRGEAGDEAVFHRQDDNTAGVFSFNEVPLESLDYSGEFV